MSNNLLKYLSVLFIAIIMAVSISASSTQALTPTLQPEETSEPPGNPPVNIVTPLPPNPIEGDADGDGRLSVKDATCIQKYLAYLITEKDINLEAANISKSGTVSIFDATMIQKKLAHLI